MTPQRIVSLIASGTEIVAALGRSGQLVGRSHECDFPPSVGRLPVCSEPRIDVNCSSRQIDQQVKSVLSQDALSIYRVDAGMLQRLSPTVIITQTLCEVCAVSLKDVEDAVCSMIGDRPLIVPVEPNTLDDIFADIRAVARGLDAVGGGDRLVASLRERLDNLTARTSAIRPKPGIACIEWIDPLMAAGNWVPELVKIAGGRPLLGQQGHHSPWITWDQLSDADPDVIAVMPCGFDVERTRREISVLTENDDWGRLNAVRNGRVYLTDGNQFFNRPGPRIVESAEILAELLHPDRFDFGHEGMGWVRLG